MSDDEVEIKVVSFHDTKMVVDESGNEGMVHVFIPECCREGWDSCPHVINRPKTKTKRNIGL